VRQQKREPQRPEDHGTTRLKAHAILKVPRR
jgi:hypothetical protein